MIRLLYDDQIFRFQRFGGISRYFAELLKGMNAFPEFESFPTRLYSDNHHLREKQLTYLDIVRESRPFKGKARIENFILRKQKRRFTQKFLSGSFDLFHPTYFMPDEMDKFPESKKLVITVYDMIHELYYDKVRNEEQPETRNKRTLLFRADHIIAISQNTKEDILRIYPQISADKISVIYLGSSLRPKRDQAEPQTKKHILFVGNRGDYKNFNWFFKSVSSYLAAKGHTLVCAGSSPFTDQEKAIIADAGLSSLVRHVPIASDEDLIKLYEHAHCFVFPSIYEGFGIPILEAFSCRCPVVLPRSSCFPEIAEQAALYFEPGDADGLTKQLEAVISDPEQARQLIRAGTARLQEFNWKNTIAEHRLLYTSVINNS